MLYNFMAAFVLIYYYKNNIDKYKNVRVIQQTKLNLISLKYIIRK